MIHCQADVDERAVVDSSSDVWPLAQIREFAYVGSHSSIGRGAYIDRGVTVGSNCKIQNGAMLYSPAVIEDGVFIGPGCILTNDRHPRAVSSIGMRKSSSDWDAVGVNVGTGASIGAGAICVAPIRIGRWALVAAGAVVTSSVPDFALVAGIPARRIGWVGRDGVPLVQEVEGSPIWKCPTTGKQYLARENSQLEEIN